MRENTCRGADQPLVKMPFSASAKASSPTQCIILSLHKEKAAIIVCFTSVHRVTPLFFWFYNNYRYCEIVSSLLVLHSYFTLNLCNNWQTCKCYPKANYTTLQAIQCNSLLRTHAYTTLGAPRSETMQQKLIKNRRSTC